MRQLKHMEDNMYLVEIKGPKPNAEWVSSKRKYHRKAEAEHYASLVEKHSDITTRVVLTEEARAARERTAKRLVDDLVMQLEAASC